jgi:FG-GAP repeat/FG-GAP-like repeat
MASRSAVLVTALAPLLATARAQTPLVVVNAIGQSATFGADANPVGDWDGDGIGDVAVGIPDTGFGVSGPGSVRIRSGRDGSGLALFTGAALDERFGALVAGVGDVDGDGSVDLAVGSAPILSTPPTRVQIFSGATGALLFTKPLTWYELQTLVAPGDVDADGHPDVAEGGLGGAAGAGSSINPGIARIFSVATGGLLQSWLGDENGDHFGEGLAAVGDVNGDGYADLAIGASEADNYDAEDTGYLRLVSGSDGAMLLTVDSPGPQLGQQTTFGQILDGVGDVDGDGRRDLVVGVRQEHVGSAILGAARVYSGADGSLLRYVPGTIALAQFGLAVAGPGDLDGDGVPDFAVGTTQLDVPGTPQLGYQVFSGADASLLQTAPLAPSSLDFDFVLRAAGDINADAMPDLLAVVHFPAPPTNGYASLRVLSGKPLFFADLGHALAGSAGTPQLQIEGVPGNALPLHFSLSGAPAFAPLFLIAGFNAVSLPFHGGVLVPAPTIVVAGLMSDGAGALTLGTQIAFAPPSGLKVIVQVWMPDPQAPTHFAASNAVEGIAP